MAQSGSSAGHDGSTGTRVVARAHHGSVSKEQRAQIEADLKSGQLPCVVATSSLELGIDMGAVDIVVQVEAPPSVASGLQRVGRAGHQVGATSRGVFFPNHRGDLIESAVVVERMRVGAIEEVATLRNPLDVLAQQVVAVVAAAAIGGPAGTPTEIKADDVYALVRRADGFRELPHSAFEATLDMLSGRYPSEDFAELRPRIVWQRDTGVLTGRPGAQRLAVTSGGTIPDRGLFGVFLVGEGSASGKPQPRSPGRRAGRGDGLRDPGRRRLHPRHHQLAGRADHPRPGAGLPRSGRARPAPVLEGRLSAPPAGAGPSLRCLRPRDRHARAVGGLRAAARRPGWTSSRPATCRATWPSSTRRRQRCPPTPQWWSSGSATSSATGASACTPRSAPAC